MEAVGKLELHFPGATPADAGRLVHDLADLIRKEDQSISVTTERASEDAMDGGTILILLLGTPVAVALARGIADWIRKRGDPELIIKSGKDQIVIQSGLTADQKFELVKTALTKTN